MELTKKEIESILGFSNNYFSLHSQIEKIEKEMQDLEEKASNLIEDLKERREEEKKFMEILALKYGDGRLNPTNLSWEIKNKDYENVK